MSYRHLALADTFFVEASYGKTLYILDINILYVLLMQKYKEKETVNFTYETLHFGLVS